MSNPPYKAIGIGSLVICAISSFVAWERYQDNASKVAAANKMMQSSPLGGMMRQMTGSTKLEPGVPTASKYAIALALLSGVGGIVCLSMPPKKQDRRTASRSGLPNKLPPGLCGNPSEQGPSEEREGG